MTKLFLAAGVAALAITASASAAPGGHGQGGQGGKDRVQRASSGGGADRRAARVEQRQQQRVSRVERADNRGARLEQRSVARNDRAQARAERSENRAFARAERVDNRGSARADRNVARMDRVDRRDVARAERIDRRNMARADRMDRHDVARAERLDNRVRRIEDRRNGGYAVGYADARGRGLIDGCPPGLAKKDNGCLPPGQAAKMGLGPVVTRNTAAMIRAARVDDLNRRLGYRVASPLTAASLLGLPLSQANSVLALDPLPQSIRYLYPSNAMYDYRYGDGYVYQVDRSSNLIASLIPLLAGGYLPGQTLPQTYMNSYVPNYYGYNSFYPNYQDQCTRYANGVVYYVDCGSGLIDNVMPLYDSGYGVGQLLPSSYGYYNVPDQYRPYYYDSGNTGYWYAPGAIYQYDRSNSLITSVAALLSPGLTIGQPLPTGYGVYNVPMSYRDRYMDTPDSWYRYSNGNIYQVDPLTQLVTAVVASALT